jgi:hypothetical protein
MLQKMFFYRPMTHSTLPPAVFVERRILGDAHKFIVSLKKKGRWRCAAASTLITHSDQFSTDDTRQLVGLHGCMDGRMKSNHMHMVHYWHASPCGMWRLATTGHNH